MKIVTLLLFLSCSYAAGFLDVMQNYLNYKYLSLGYVFSCLSTTEKGRLAKELSKISVRFILLDVNKSIYNTEKFLIQERNIAIIVNGSCANVTPFFEQFYRYTDFNEKKHWLVFGKDISISHHFDNVNINANADITLAISKHLHFWDLFELYNTGYAFGGKIFMNSLGYYNKKEGFVITEIRNKYWRRKNMENIHVKLATMLTYPYKGKLQDYMRSDKIDKAVDTMNRVGYTIVTQCLKFYNISWSIILTHSWGYPDKNGSFDGIIGEVQRKRADIGTGLYVRPDRITYVDYGPSMYILTHDIMFLGQGSVTPFLIYIRPLEANVWYVLIVVIGFIQILLRVIQTVENKTMNSSNENTWSQSIICILGHLCQQGASDVPHLFSGRILIFTVSQFALLLFQLYSASVVSSLLIKPTSDIHSLDDFVQSKLEFGCEDLKYVRDLFNNANSPSLKELKRKKLKESHYMPPKDGLALVNKGGFAYFTELNTGYPIIEKTFSNRHICDLQKLDSGQLIQNARVHPNYQKSSPFRKMINVCIRRLDETSFNNRLRSQWMSRAPTCFREPYLAASVGLYEFLPLATLLFVGYLTSYIILVFEIFWDRFHKRQKRDSIHVLTQK